MQTDQSPSREAVARIIAGFGPCRPNETWGPATEAHYRDAERKADAILALLTPATPQPATGEVKVEQRHREAAAETMSKAWIIGDRSSDYDRILDGRLDEHWAVQAFARFERDHLTPATQPDVSIPVVFFDSSLPERRIDALENAFERCGGRVSVVGWKALIDQLRAAIRPQPSQAIPDARALREAIEIARGMLSSFAGQPNHMGDVFKVLDAALAAECPIARADGEVK